MLYRENIWIFKELIKEVLKYQGNIDMMGHLAKLLGFVRAARVQIPQLPPKETSKKLDVFYLYTFPITVK